MYFARPSCGWTIGDDLYDEQALTSAVRRYGAERLAVHQQEYDDTLGSSRVTRN